MTNPQSPAHTGPVAFAEALHQQAKRKIGLIGSVVGSHMHGLATTASDVDYLGVYVANPTDLLGRSPSNYNASIHQSTPSVDVTAHELTKFCNLALKANPTILDLLWSSAIDTEFMSLTTDLRSIRLAFVADRQVRNTAAGMANQIALKLDPTRMSPPALHKQARRVAHTLHITKGFVSTGVYNSNVTNVVANLDDYAQLAVTDLDRFLSRVTADIRNLDSMSTALPTEPDLDAVDAWVNQVRTESYKWFEVPG